MSSNKLFQQFFGMNPSKIYFSFSVLFTMLVHYDIFIMRCQAGTKKIVVIVIGFHNNYYY